MNSHGVVPAFRYMGTLHVIRHVLVGCSYHTTPPRCVTCGFALRARCRCTTVLVMRLWCCIPVLLPILRCGDADCYAHTCLPRSCRYAVTRRFCGLDFTRLFVTFTFTRFALPTLPAHIRWITFCSYVLPLHNAYWIRYTRSFATRTTHTFTCLPPVADLPAVTVALLFAHYCITAPRCHVPLRSCLIFGYVTSHVYAHCYTPHTAARCGFVLRYVVHGCVVVLTTRRLFYHYYGYRLIRLRCAQFHVYAFCRSSAVWVTRALRYLEPTIAGFHTHAATFTTAHTPHITRTPHTPLRCGVHPRSVTPRSPICYRYSPRCVAICVYVLLCIRCRDFTTAVDAIPDVTIYTC